MEVWLRYGALEPPVTLLARYVGDAALHEYEYEAFQLKSHHRIHN